MLITKEKAYEEAENLGEGFIANVILNWDSNPAKKLRGLVKLLRAGHSVRLGRRIDVLLIDDVISSWEQLEEV